MDVDTIVPENGHEAVHGNGAHGQYMLTEDDQSILKQADEVSDIAALNATLENTKLEDHGIVEKSSLDEVEHHDDGSRIPQEVEQSERVNLKSSESNAKVMASTESKKSKDGKLFGVVAPNLNLKKPTKSRSFSDRQVQSHASKDVVKPSAVGNEVARDQMKLKPLKKPTHDKHDEDSQSTESPTAEDAKPRRVGALPNYGFSFKCDERAEKRREFYTKLEEKIHAKEVEKTNLQAKSKETQEAEIKLLRKSLTFKATPMPNFYQEPVPPKTELKKIPTTRARSPKLGRKKISGGEESEDNNGHNHPSGRFSLDSASRNNSTKVSSHGITKKLVQKSLTKLPSEKTSPTVASSKAKKPSKAVNKEDKAPNGSGAEEKVSVGLNESASLTQVQEQDQENEPIESEPHADNVPGTLAVEPPMEH